jgi:hypothetical protein
MPTPIDPLRATFKHSSNLALGFPADIITAEFQFNDGVLILPRQFVLALFASRDGFVFHRSIIIETGNMLLNIGTGEKRG